MTIFLTEKSADGIYSALFYAFTEKVAPDRVFELKGYSQNFTDRHIIIETDAAKNQRVKTALKKYGGEKTVEGIKLCLLSCDNEALTIAFNFCYKTLLERRDVSQMLAEKAVSDFLYTIKTVLCERHKFLGFIRFRETANGVLYAEYSPDNDITELLCPHFLSRLSLTPFIIHDLKRHKAGISNGKRFKIFTTQQGAVLTLSDDEKAWEKLWKNYYRAVNIKERKNKKQQDNLMPVRYRKFLPETYE